MYIDTHTHLYTEEFDNDRAEVLARAREAGATALLLPAIDEGSLPSLLQLCAEAPDLCHPMLGLHPTELPGSPAEVEATLRRFEKLLEEDAHGKRRFVAVGEVGIDLYWDNTRREEQAAAFHRQAEWAARFDLPLMVHCRNAHRELIDSLLPVAAHCLASYGRPLAGVFHCFGGTADEARELLERFPTFVLGIGGVLTYKKSTLPAVLHSTVPLHRIVLETDAPYLAPVPHRGKRNEPSFLPAVIQRLADIYEVTPQEIEQATTATAKALFKL